MSIRSNKIVMVFGLIVSAASLQLSASPAADGARLDSVEGEICSHSLRLNRAVAGAAQMRRDIARDAQQMGRGDETEQRRAFLQQEISKRALGAQDQIVAETRSQLLSNQAEYRRLVGKDFDVSQCDGGRVRVTHAMRAQEQQERDWQAGKNMRDKVMADRETNLQAVLACDDWKTLQQPTEKMERFRPGYQAEARARFTAFTNDYRLKNGKAFDTARCR